LSRAFSKKFKNYQIQVLGPRGIGGDRSPKTEQKTDKKPHSQGQIFLILSSKK
jgi:hypothetical protein